MSNEELRELSRQYIDVLNDHIDDATLESIDSMLSKIGNHLFLTPLNALEQGKYCYRGGLADFSLTWCRKCLELKHNNPLDFGNVSERGIVLLCLLGQVSKSALIVNDVAYQVYKDGSELRGYKFSFSNEYYQFQISKSFGMNTLFLFQKFGIALTDEEYNAYMGICNLLFGDYWLSSQTNSFKRSKLEILLDLGYGLIINS